MDENIFDHLIVEHDQMRAMMINLEQGYDEETFNQFGQTLEQHQEAEEEVLYDRLKSDQSIHTLVLEGIEEHRLAADLLHKLQHERGGTDVWTAKMKVLKESVEHHLREEEDELFPQAQTIISDREAVGLNEKFESQEERIRAHA